MNYPDDPWLKAKYCHCMNVGADGTREHSPGVYLMEMTRGLSKGRRAWGCANHLAGYEQAGWVVIGGLEKECRLEQNAR